MSIFTGLQRLNPRLSSQIRGSIPLCSRLVTLKMGEPEEQMAVACGCERFAHKELSDKLVAVHE